MSIYFNVFQPRWVASAKTGMDADWLYDVASGNR
jgi:hypothetical protein